MNSWTIPSFRLRWLLALALLAGLGLCPSADSAPSTGASESSESYPYVSWVKPGAKFGAHRELATIDTFVPFGGQPDRLYFVDLRGKDASGPESEFNAGFGHRRIIDDSWILGGYAYFDRLRSPYSNYFSQGTLGLEFLTPNLDGRVNVYVPESKKKLASDTVSSSVLISGNSISVASVRSQSHEMALPGADAEVGARLPVAGQDVRVYGGGFFYDRSGAERVAGPRARAEWRIEDLFGWTGVRGTIEGEYSYDDVRGSEGFGGFSVRIPLDLASRKTARREDHPLRARMTEAVIRDVDVVSGNQNTSSPFTQPALNPATGEPYSSIWYAQAGGAGAGTLADPTDVATAVASAGTNGVVALLDGGGTVDVAGLTLLDGQTLIGSAGNLSVQASSASLGYRIPGTSTTLVDTGGGDVVTLTGNNTVSSLTINNGGIGIFGNNAQDVAVSDVTVTGMNGYGIYLTNPGNVVITGSTFNSPADTGFYIVNASGNVSVLSTTVSNNNGYGMRIEGTDGLVTLRGVTADDNFNSNLRIINSTGGVVIDASTFTGSDNGYGIEAQTLTGDIRVSGTTVSQNSDHGLYIDGVTGGASVSGITSRSNLGYGLMIQNLTGSVTASGVTLDDNFNSGLRIFNVDGSASVSSSSFTDGINLHGIEVLSVDGAVALSGLTVSGNAQQGLNLDTVGGDLTIASSTFTGQNGYGAIIASVTGDLTASGITASQNFNSGFRVFNVGGDVSVASSTFNDSTNEDGLQLFSVTGSIGVSGVTADDNNESGVQIDSNASVVTLSSIAATGNGVSDIQLDNYTSYTLTASSYGTLVD